MARVKVFTDSAADIPKELAEELDISVIPIKLHMDGETYIDGVTLQAEEFYERLPFTSSFPTTSQPSPMDFSEAYKKAFEEEKDIEIFSIHLSSALSGTYQSAVLAKSMLEEENLPSITIMDSRSATYGLGMVVVAAARAAKEGKSLSDCMKVAQYYIDNQKVIFTVDTLEYIQKGGRIGKAAALVGTLLNITPILSLENGEVNNIDKVRGKSKVLQRVFELMRQNIPSGAVSVGILHGNNEEGANTWLEKIKELYDVKECVITPLGPSIGTHAGPGALAAVLVPLQK